RKREISNSSIISLVAATPSHCVKKNWSDFTSLNYLLGCSFLQMLMNSRQGETLAALIHEGRVSVDPFLRISRIADSGASTPICRTEVVDNNLNPTWNPVYSLAVQQYGGKENPLIIDCFDFNSTGKHELIGGKRQ
ncbi:Bonzai-like protein, partial [Thalictrum thalictroides]